jgi:hypothetical protein
MIMPNQYTGLMVNYSKAGYGRGEPFPIPVEQPTILKEALSHHFQTLGYTIDEMASLLMMERSDFVKPIVLDTDSV